MNEKDVNLWKEYKADWNRFAKEVLNVSLDSEQKKIVESVQNHRRVSVRSGHARGKDYVGAVIPLCFLYTHYPSTVILSAPTDRQVVSIMMAEIAKIHNNANIQLPGRVLEKKIKFEGESKWFLLGFKAADKKVESWTGFHNENVMVVFTEASGMVTETFDAAEGLLTGNSKFLIVFNPNQASGESYKSTKSPLYVKHELSCLDAPNVKAKKTIYPGQVDYLWVKERIQAWCTRIDEDEKNDETYDFEFEDQWYRPNGLFRVKVLGEYAAESDNQLIPLRWVELSNEKWLKRKELYPDYLKNPLRIGFDVAGMGRDNNVSAHRYGTVVEKVKEEHPPIVNPELIHMAVAGLIKNYLKQPNSQVFVDTIGEGAGVHSRLAEEKENSVSVKFSGNAKRLTDMTGERTFANMRSFCYWAVRDALDPKIKETDLLLPPDEMLTEELTEIMIKGLRSDGSILLELKEDIETRLKRSTDKSDAVALTYYPRGNASVEGIVNVTERESAV